MEIILHNLYFLFKHVYLGHIFVLYIMLSSQNILKKKKYSLKTNRCVLTRLSLARLGRCLFLECQWVKWLWSLKLRFFFLLSPKDMFINFKEMGGGRGRQGDRHRYERETWISCPAWALTGDESLTPVCAMTVGWTGNLLVYGTTLQPTEQPG